MARIAFKKYLRPDKRAEYLALHAAVPLAVTHAYRSAGIRNLSVFIDGNEIVVYLECQDFASAQETLASDAACIEWDSCMAELLEEHSNKMHAKSAHFFGECYHMN